MMTNKEDNIKKGSTPQDRSNPDQSPSEVKLKRDLTLWNGVGLIVGSTVGTGIFISPGGVLKYSGSIGLSLLVWVFTGMMSAIGAHCYAELGTMIPKSGGMYIYLLEGYGELVAFLSIWMYCLMQGPAGLIIISYTFANYILQPMFANCEEIPIAAIKAIAVLLIGFITWLNYYSTKWAVTVQDVLTFSKVLALHLIGILGMYFLVTGHVENYEEPFTDSNWSLISLSTAYFQCFFTYSGWNNLNYISEELKNPIRDVPRAIWISISLITFIYLLVNVSYFVLLSPDEILSSYAVATSFGNKIYGGLGWLISILVASSCFGSFLSGIITGSRLSYSAGREGHFPKCFALINLEKMNPMASILITGAQTAALLFLSDIYSVMNYIGFAGNIFLWLSIVSLLILRYKKPDLPRPIKVWIGFPIIYSIFGLIIIVLPIFQDPLGLGITLLITLSGIPVYILCIKWTPSKKIFNYISDKISTFLQILLMSCPETANEGEKTS